MLIPQMKCNQALPLRTFGLVLLWALSFGVPVSAGDSVPVKSIAGLEFEPPQHWTDAVPESTMRVFEFEIPGFEDSEKGEMAVFYFGSGQGGSVEANIERWKSQFDFEEQAAPAMTSRFKINDLPVTTIHLEGTYLGMGRSAPQPDYAVLGAIAEGPEGPVFFKAMGPKKAISRAKPDFETFLRTIRPL